MGLLSSSQTIVRYHVQKPDVYGTGRVIETVLNGLKANTIPDIKNDYDEIVVGWTPFNEPYDPDFEKHPFTIGDLFVFSLRIDKKTIPAKALEEQLAIVIKAKLSETGRDFLSKAERAEMKDIITDRLMMKVPFVPAVHDVVWNYESGTVMFFSSQSAANELFETMFFRSFGLKMHQIFPYTLASRDSEELIEKVSQTAPICIGRAA